MILRRIYTGVWREDLPPLEFTLPELFQVLPGLLRDGGAGVLWPRIRDRIDDYGAVGEILERAYLLNVAHLSSIESEIELLASTLAAKGIEPVLVKGWSLSVLYAAPQIRRPGDIDLIVPSHTYTEARHVIESLRGHGLTTSVDLYSDDNWRSRPSRDFRQHLIHVPCGDGNLAILDSTDALRQVCLHFVRHLANRVPLTSMLWLCDIGALVEHSGEIDWQRLFYGDAVAASQIRSALALSRNIVDIDPEALPVEIARIQLSNWAFRSICTIWIDPHTSLSREIQISGMRKALAKRFWPSPLNAILRCNAPINETFPVRYQVEASARLLARYGTRVATFGRFGR